MGHYYTYIFDRKQQKWYKFNDYRVTEVDSKIVFDEGFGDVNSKTKACAYKLIYINQE